MKNYFYKQLIFSILLLAPFSIFAKSLPKQQLLIWGTNAFSQKTGQSNPVLKDYAFIGDTREPLLVILNFEDGFLVLAGDDASMPVLAYSPTGTLDLASSAPGCKMWIEQYQNEISAIRNLKATPSVDIRRQWQNLSEPSAKEVNTVMVSPLLTAAWNQNKYYNSYSPVDAESPAGYDSRTPNGCVAVAMAMILYYYRYPIQGTGSHTNYTDYGNYYVNFAQQTYHYEAMEDQLTHYSNEVSKLIFHCATAVDMMYAPDGSGAYSFNVPDALTSYFGYDSDCQYISKDNTSIATWKDYLKQDLDAGRPVYYSGCNDDGCHAFVCDGYDSDDYFHFNFGWGGNSNGYYALENTGGASNAIGSFSSSQSVVRNIYPGNELYPYNCSSSVINNCLCGTIEDGSSNLDYPNNADCTYVITGDSAISVAVHLQHFETQNGTDFLKFWNGNPSNGQLLLSLSGDMPATTSYNFTTDSLYITFTSDGNTTAAGWRFDYAVTREMAPCNSEVYHTYSGSISDGSGDAEYRSNANCYWTLRLPEATYITFTFHSFDLSPEDELRFYDISASPYTLLASYSGETVPDPVTFYNNKVQINFISDNYLNADGFSLSWLADSLTINTDGVADFADEAISLYPNPVSNALFVKTNFAIRHPDITILDASGRKMVDFSCEPASDGTIKINVSRLANGFYTVWIQEESTFCQKKFIIAR